MMLCVLCLQIIDDKLDSIKTNSTQWQNLDIVNKIETHFWSLNIMQHNSCICLACWGEVDGFHKFYLRIEEAHMNLYKIKVEDAGISDDCKEDLEIKVPNTKNNVEASHANRLAYCFLEPEILIDQTQPEARVESNIIVDKEYLITSCKDEINVDDMPLQKVSKRQKPQNDLASKDPLAKSKKLSVDKFGKNKNSKRRASTDEEKPRDYKKLKVKEVPIDLIDNSNNVAGNDNKIVDNNFLLEKLASENVKSKSYTKREECDNFIAEHFKCMFCDLCQEPFKDFSVMQKHFLETHQQRGYVVCCKRKYYRRSLLVDHIHCHLNPDYFKCDKCNKVMSDRLRLEEHIMWVHRSEEVVRKHCCDECGKTFANARCLRRHKSTHLSEEEKKFPCNECGKFYASSHLLHYHIQAVHLKKNVKICYICGKSISTSADYITHMNKHLGVPEPIISCDICGLRVTTERGLKRHKEGQHPIGGKKEHQCPKCPKKSPTLEALRKHISTMHENGYDHKCTICQKAFKRAEVLREHMASHTGTPLYTCPWCPKTFNSNGNMHAHRKKMHPKEWEEAKLQKYYLNAIPAAINDN